MESPHRQSNNAKAGLLTTDIGEDGYPVSTTNETSIGDLFKDDYKVNHLFIQSVYDESGYFEYDSTKNFAYLNGTDFEVYELVLDLGGVHSAMTGSVNFRTSVVTGRNGTRTLREIFESNYRQRDPNATDADVAAYLDRFFEDGGTVFKDYSTHSMKVLWGETAQKAVLAPSVCV